MNDWQKIRELFPTVKKYTYLNTASAPPISTCVAEEGIRFYEEMLLDGDLPWEQWLIDVEKVRMRAARLISAQAHEVAFTTSTSHGMSLIAGMLKGKGSVITTADEFPAATFPWLQQGFRLSFVESAHDGAITAEDFEKAIEGDTKILVVSHVEYSTGFRHDLEVLGKLCKKKGIIFVVDATQSMGAFSIDVKKCHIDFLVVSGYKWLMAGYGIGLVYMSEPFLRPALFPMVGWLSVENPERPREGSLDLENEKMTLKRSAAALEAGCPHFPNIFALGGALQLIEEVGQTNITERISQLSHYLAQEIERNGFRIASTRRNSHQSGITIVEMENSTKIVEALARKKIIVSARWRGLRVSTHVFNNFEDIDCFARALRGLTEFT